MFFLVWGITFRFHGNAFAGIADGSKEAIRDRFSNAEILMHADERDTLLDCMPLSDHISQEGFNKMQKAIKNHDYEGARNAVLSYTLETAAPWCIDSLKRVAVLLSTTCPALLRDALPTSYF